MKNLKNHLLLLLTVIGIIAIVASCKKSSSNNTSITKENIAGSYKLTGVSVTVPPFPAQDVTDSIPACQRDDIVKLNVDLSMVYTDAGTKCAPPGDFNSTWSLSGNNISIDTLSGVIQKFDGKVLIINSDINFNGISGTSTETFTKQ